MILFDTKIINTNVIHNPYADRTFPINTQIKGKPSINVVEARATATITVATAQATTTTGKTTATTTITNTTTATTGTTTTAPATTTQQRPQ